MNTRYNLVNETNRSNFYPNKTTIKKPSNKYSLINKPSKFTVDKSKHRQSKSNFVDSDDDCSIIVVNKSSANELNIPLLTTSKPNPFAINRFSTNNNSSKVNIDKTNPINFQATGVYNNAEEKFKLLDDLESYIASYSDTLGLDRPSLAGTCQDMCPEKERYWKETADNISIFEKDDNDQLDHRKAVKDYERCSAAQKEPHPHELRPTDVLDRTMNYLLKHIVDSNVTKVSWRQWYSFLWTRTRSIRKDIAQQNLCNPTVIKIVEIITRFHIFCAARLCEESKDDFENQYNEENLKNCLQSLKDMYRDMPTHSCRFEPEFRSYMIIMNLDKGEVLGEAQNLPIPVLRSEEMRFAIRVSQAVKTNNYVRFFRLIQKADFITSCLLHRFIVPMRLRAFRVVNKAYVANKSAENQVPLAYLYKILGFESLEEAGKFCTGTGFILEDDNSTIILNSTFNIPDNYDEFIKRSFKLVEVKQGSQKLSNLFCCDPDIEFESGVLPCKMISFNDRNHYTGLLKFPANKTAIRTTTDNSSKLRNVASKDNFDLSDSDFNPTPESGRKSRTGEDTPPRSALESIKTRLTLPEQRPPTNIFTITPGHRIPNLFGSSGVESNSIFQNNLSSTMSNTSNKAVPHSLFDKTSQGLFSQHRIVNNLLSQSSPFINLPASNQQESNSNKIEFYLPTNKSGANSELSSTEDDTCDFPEEDFNMIADDINTQLIGELCEKTCRTFAEIEIYKTIESERVNDSLVKEIITNVVTTAYFSVKEEYKCQISEQHFKELSSEIIEQCCQNTMTSCRKNEMSVHKRNNTLQRNYFKYWKTFTAQNMTERSSLVNLSAAPRLVDDFTVCEGFRVKVRKISTTDMVWSRHPIIERLEQCTLSGSKGVAKKVAKKNTVAQTISSYADFTTVSVSQFVRQFVNERFISVLDSHRSVLEFAKQVDPSPEKIISDYNKLVDYISSITVTSANLSLTKDMILPVICLSTEPLSDWSQYMQHVFTKLSITSHDKQSLLQEMYTILKYLDNSLELPELSYYHLRLFPWIKMTKHAVLNRLSLIDRKYSDIRMEIPTHNAIMCGRLQLENTLNGLSIEKCVLECDKHRLKYAHRTVNSPIVKNPRRLSAYQELVNKITELEQKIDECK